MTALFIIAVAAAPNTVSIRYLALGDSFTVGTGAKDGEDFPSLVAKSWRKPGRTVELKNLAVNGYTSQQLISRELPLASAFAPTHVTVLIGANDIMHRAVLDTYRAQIRRIVERLIASGLAPAAICVLPQPNWALSTVGQAETDEKTLLAWNNAAREVAVEHGACYVDLFPLMQKQAQKGMWSKDGLHPNAAAYAEWARFFVDNNPWGLH